MVIVTAEPKLTVVPAIGFWFITVPRLLHMLSTALFTVPSTRPAACSCWVAAAVLSPARLGTATNADEPTARPYREPSATWLTCLRLVTGAGTGLLAQQVPWPKPPQLLLPQVSSVPSERTAALSEALAAIWVMPTSVVSSGRSRWVVVPSPSCPASLPPQA